ncbi:MAG: SUMF1/EgtB/PvdO family nonheme iron enzyme, partial [Planctomycetota bacterium]|nr:SUMF1/EgtB/PvdO family nonheme iron enzyme [Planctomycetota bacterium]
THRVLRGGSYLVSQHNCRSASRFWSHPAETKFYIGFRVARDAPPDEDLKPSEEKEGDEKSRKQ